MTTPDLSAGRGRRVSGPLYLGITCVVAPWHPANDPCQRDSCWMCTPFTGLRDWIGDTPWGRRIFQQLLRATPRITTVEQVTGATDKQLLDVWGIGTGALQYLRDRQRGRGETIDRGLNTDPRSPTEVLAALIEAELRARSVGGALP